MITFHKHAVWPIKYAEQGESHAGYFFINYQKRPFGIFETFSPKPTFHRLPLRHKKSDFMIEQQILKDHPHLHLLEYLNHEMRLFAIETLSARFQDCKKAGRSYEHSRYWDGHGRDMSLFFVTNEHWSALEEKAKYKQLDSTTFLRALHEERITVHPVEGKAPAQQAMPQLESSLTHTGMIEELRKAAALQAAAKLPETEPLAPRVTQDPEEFAKMQARLDAMDDIDD